MHTMSIVPCRACGDLCGCQLPEKIKDNRLSFEEFWGQQAEWSQATFGTDAERGPAGPLKHLAKEVQEALANPADVMEFADLLFLVFDATRRAGFSCEDLRLAVNVKLKVNRARVWPKPTTDEPVEHVRDGQGE